MSEPASWFEKITGWLFGKKMPAQKEVPCPRPLTSRELDEKILADAERMRNYPPPFPEDPAPVEILSTDGTRLSGLFHFPELPPEKGDLVRLELSWDGHLFHAEAETYFEALANIRQEMEPLGYRPCCQGARINVYPSAMALDMGDAYRAYRWEKTGVAPIAPLVCIFDPDPECAPVTVEEQRNFYASLWAKALGRNSQAT